MLYIVSVNYGHGKDTDLAHLLHDDSEIDIKALKQEYFNGDRYKTDYTEREKFVKWLIAEKGFTPIDVRWIELRA